MYSQTLFSALEIRENSHSLTLNERTDWNGLRAPVNSENSTESMENQWSEWMIFQGHTALQIVREIKEMKNLGCEPEHFQGRIIFMSMHNDIEWENQNNERVCLANVLIVHMPESSLWVIGYSLGQVQKRNGTRQTLSSLEENGTESQNS